MVHRIGRTPLVDAVRHISSPRIHRRNHCRDIARPQRTKKALVQMATCTRHGSPTNEVAVASIFAAAASCTDVKASPINEEEAVERPPPPAAFQLSTPPPPSAGNTTAMVAAEDGNNEVGVVAMTEQTVKGSSNSQRRQAADFGGTSHTYSSAHACMCYAPFSAATITTFPSSSSETSYQSTKEKLLIPV